MLLPARVAMVAVLLFAGASITACGRQETQGLGSVDALVPGGGDGTVVIGDSGDPLDGAPVGFDGNDPSFDTGIAPADGGPGPGVDTGPAPEDGGPGPGVDSGPATDGGSFDGALPVDGGPGPGRDGGPGDGGPLNRDSGVSPTDAGLCTQDSDCGRGGGFNVFCDAMTGQCLECFDNSHCRGSQVCDLGANECRSGCFPGGRCAPGQTCDPSNNACVDCLTDTDCNGGDVCNTTTHDCVECATDAHCAGNVGRPVCDAASESCVGCAVDTDCTGGQVCDTQIMACVSQIGMRALCEPCTLDSQCGGNGNLCIGINAGGSTFIDRTCALDCSAASCPSGFECVDVRSGTARQCRPRYAMQNPSCTAISHLGDACPFSATESDPGCGLSGRQDALCILAPGGMGGVCTIGCDDATDCPTGFTCTGAAPGQTGVCL